MLSATNNDLLCNVSPGRPMHNAFKQVWLPVMRTDKLEAGGAPVKFMILSEDYVAFRAEDGRVGVFAEKCPHRGCSLALAQNKDCALTCIFHGWKFDVSGQCVETPNVQNPDFPAKVPLKYYPSREAGDALWVYFGEGETPQFPDLIFNRLKPEQILSRAAICHYNWLTGLEAILDPSHVGLLHQNWLNEAPNQGYSADINLMGKSTPPALDIEPTGYGFRYSAIRTTPADTQYIRVTEHISPNGCFIANSKSTRKLFIISVPIDNEHSIQWYFWHNPLGPLTEEDRLYALGATDADHSNFYQTPKQKPSWGQDREAMKNGTSFTGFTDIMFEDFIAGESQGAIIDRTKEFPVPADKAIMWARRFMLDKLKRQEEGQADIFRHTNDFKYGALQSITAETDSNADWKQVTDQRTAARTKNLGIV
jgi:phthalate 4,5-dioxygenase